MLTELTQVMTTQTGLGLAVSIPEDQVRRWVSADFLGSSRDWNTRAPSYPDNMAGTPWGEHTEEEASKMPASESVGYERVARIDCLFLVCSGLGE